MRVVYMCLIRLSRKNTRKITQQHLWLKKNNIPSAMLPEQLTIFQLPPSEWYYISANTRRYASPDRRTR